MTTTTNTRSTAMSVEEIRAAQSKVAGLRRRMTFLLPLTAAERREHRSARIGPKTLRTVENRTAAARKNRDKLPPSFDLRKLERDTAVMGALGECLAGVEELRADLHDTLLAVANRASVAAAAAYSYIKVASNTAEQLKRTVERIATRGGRSAAKGIDPAEVPKPAEPAEPAGPEAAPDTPADKAA